MLEVTLHDRGAMKLAERTRIRNSIAIHWYRSK